MANQTIISLAILKVNWESQRKSYLDNFVPIVAESIRHLQEDIVSLPNLQQQIETRFGLKFPQNAVKTILARVRKQGYIRLENKVYKRNPDKLAKLGFSQIQQRVVAMHESLIDNLITFCSSKFSVTWGREDAEAAIQSYFRENELIVISALTDGTVIPAVKYHIKSAKFLVSSFVQHLQETHTAGLEYLETIAKGNMLANAIFLPDPGHASKKFRNVEIFFDTPFLICALGYAGEPRKAPCAELMELVYETGADLRCFRHTLEEIRGVLDACAKRISSRKLAEAYGPSVEYFLSKGYSSSDIELLAVQLERHLKALRVSVVDKPPYIPEYIIDEKGLSEKLEQEIDYRTEQPLYRDVDSISAIMRLRRGEEFFDIEECRALLVTTNLGVAKASRAFFRKDASLSAIAPCLTDYALTNLLWLKKPLRAPELPRKRIIADCYATTQPNERLWRLYIAEVEKLEQQQGITTDDYYMLRHSYEAKQMLMGLTSGEEEAFTQGTVPEILELIRHRMQAGLKEELELERKRREEAEQAVVDVKLQVQAGLKEELELERKRRKETEREIERVKSLELAKISRVKERAQKCAHVISLVLKYGVWVLLLIGAIYTFPWELPPITSSLHRYAITSIQIILLILGSANLVWGTKVDTVIRTIEVTLGKWIEKKFLTLLGF